MPENKKILVVDDDMVRLADRMTKYLQKRGVDLTIAGNYNEAHSVITSKTFDIIFLDIGLKGQKTGMDLLKEFRTNDKKTPVYMITAYEDYEQEAIEAGATGFLVKPFDFDQHVFPLLNKK